jgi:hypothetical protein
MAVFSRRTRRGASACQSAPPVRRSRQPDTASIGNCARFRGGLVRNGVRLPSATALALLRCAPSTIHARCVMSVICSLRSRRRLGEVTSRDFRATAEADRLGEVPGVLAFPSFARPAKAQWSCHVKPWVGTWRHYFRPCLASSRGVKITVLSHEFLFAGECLRFPGKPSLSVHLAKECHTCAVIWLPQSHWL